MRQFMDGLGGRKFLAFLTATALCVFGKIDGSVWVTAMGLYVASNVVDSAADKYLLPRGSAANAQ